MSPRFSESSATRYEDSGITVNQPSSEQPSSRDHVVLVLDFRLGECDLSLSQHIMSSRKASRPCLIRLEEDSLGNALGDLSTLDIAKANMHRNILLIHDSGMSPKWLARNNAENQADKPPTGRPVAPPLPRFMKVGGSLFRPRPIEMTGLDEHSLDLTRTKQSPSLAD